MFQKPIWLRQTFFCILTIFLFVVAIMWSSQPSLAAAVDQDDHIPALLNLSSSSNQEFYGTLNGEWFYFEEQLLLPTEVYRYLLIDKTRTVQIPSSFKEHSGVANTYGTYATRVKIPKEYVGRTLAIHIPFQYSAYKIFVDRVEVASNGLVGSNVDEHHSAMSPKLGYFVPITDEILLTIQISSFEHQRGGFENSIFIGDASVVGQKFYSSMIWMLFVIGCIVIMGIFMMLFAWFRKQEKVFLIFGLFCISFAIRVFFADPFFYTLTLLRISYEWGTRLEYIFLGISVLMLILLVSQWYTKFSRRMINSITAVIVLMIITTFVTKPYIFQQLFQYVFYLSLFVVAYAIYIISRSFKALDKRDLPNLIGLTIVAIGFLNDYLMSLGWINSMKLSLLAVGIYVVIQVFTMSKSYADMVQETEELNNSLTQLNATLDEQVNTRTMELKLANEKLAHQASIDSLTGLFNRHRFNAYFRQAFQEALDNQTPLSIIMIDLDEFKKYNDYYGHLQGDQLIKQVINITSEKLPSNSLYARFGGEEFIVVLRFALQDEAFAIAESMRSAVEEAQLPHERRQCGTYATISVGVATLDQRAQYRSETELVDAADQQLYRAKREGRNRTFAASNVVEQRAD